jgi:hypothetical protein
MVDAQGLMVVSGARLSPAQAVGRSALASARSAAWRT